MFKNPVHKFLTIFVSPVSHYIGFDTNGDSFHHDFRLGGRVKKRACSSLPSAYCWREIRCRG